MVKFLIIRFSSIGDIVLTSTVVRCLKQQVEGAEVHFLTKKQFASLVSNNPFIDKVHVLDDKLKNTVEALKKEEFDYIIDLHNNLRSTRVKLQLQGISFTFNKLNFKKWLLVKLKINRMPKVHIVDRYMETLALFDVYNDGLGLNYFIPPVDQVSLVNFPEPFQKGYIALVIGANHATKIMPEQKLADLCKQIDLPIVLIGGKAEIEKGRFIAQAAGGNVINTCGEYNLNQSASLLKQANVVITHDTGMMHIAAALKKRIITIWGNTTPIFGMNAYFPAKQSVDFEVDGLKCRPCSKLGYKACPKKHFACMVSQPLEEIAQTAKQLFVC